MAEVERHLIDFLASEKAATLRRALIRKTQGILADVLMRVRLTVRSLQMPLGELQDRLSRFEQGIADAAAAAGHRCRHPGGRQATCAIARLEEEAEGLRKRARLDCQGVAQEALATATEKTEEAAAQNALRIAIPVYFEREMGTISSRFTAHMRDVLQPHRQRAGS